MLDELLKENKIIICCGCGGVGKTTTSATLGIRAAQLGRKVIVLTIDPARRLADSLGIGELNNEPKPVKFPTPLPGEMWAMMLDVKHTMDSIIVEFAQSSHQADEILKNPIYQQFSQNFGGGQEYGGMGRLYQIHEKGGYDLIVLDTPPSQHAIDFINAPMHLKDFFSQSVIKFFLPGQPDSFLGTTSQLMAKSGDFALKLLQKLTGSNFIQDLADFLSNFQGMYASFANQADRVSALLADPLTGFLIITAPDKPQLAESATLYRTLHELHLPFRGMIVNKCFPNFFQDASYSDFLDFSKTLSSRDGVAIEQMAGYARRQLAYEDRIIGQVAREIKPPAFIQKVPIFPHDVYNLEALLTFGVHLTDPENLQAFT